jgi:succinylarginine dihydrolase
VIREYNFDGLVGPTHNYGGLAPGNEASIRNEGRVSDPRAAALQGLAKMRFVHELGVGQALLPPPARPDLPTLRRLGFAGRDEEVLARVAREDHHLLRLCASSSSMWAANAATVAPSSDSRDGRVHFLPANLTTMFHRAIEAESTTLALRAIFADGTRFAVHDCLPPGAAFADEGAANHTRLETDQHAAAHLFAWGRRAWGAGRAPQRYPARQTHEASAAAARLLQLDPARVLLPQQDPAGIDAGAFHTDVLAVGHRSFLMLHELAFVDGAALESRLRALLGDALSVVWARDAELPVADAVSAYPFNSMVVTLPSGRMAIIAPTESRDNERARRFLESVVAADNPVEAVHYLDVGQSMNNGGGPACLRLRVPLRDDEAAALSSAVLYTPERAARWEGWVARHYRDRLTAAEIGDPALWREVMTALDELTGILGLPALYPFQRKSA